MQMWDQSFRKNDVSKTCLPFFCGHYCHKVASLVWFWYYSIPDLKGLQWLHCAGFMLILLLWNVLHQEKKRWWRDGCFTSSPGCRLNKLLEKVEETVWVSPRMLFCARNPDWCPSSVRSTIIDTHDVFELEHWKIRKPADLHCSLFNFLNRYVSSTLDLDVIKQFTRMIVFANWSAWIFVCSAEV